MNKQMVLVIGGPGKSGSTTIAEMLADYFQLERINSGALFRERAKEEGFDSLEDFYRAKSDEEMKKLDREVDQLLIEYGRRGNILIESKLFAAMSVKEKIPCSSRIWLDASLRVRVKRAFNKAGIKGFFKKLKIQRDLVMRHRKDKKRFKDLYNIDYDHPEKYNDLVIDNSDQTPDQTFNLIINFLKNAGIKK